MLKLSNLESIGKPVYKFHNLHSVDFDGVDDFIQLGQGFTYTQHTLSAWIKLSSLSNTHTILSGRDSNTDLIRFWVASSDNKVRFRLGDGSNTTVTNPTALEADRWYHVVATYDGTNLKIYVDSVLGHSLAASKNVNVTDNLKIGEDHLSNRFHGKIDELAIWDRALTAAEVTEIYRIKYGANLVQNGRFDELGSELAPASDFATDFEANPASGSVSQSNGTITFTNSTSTGSQVQLKNRSISTGKTYKIQFTVSNYLSGNFRISVGNQITDSITANGTYTFYVEYNNGLARNYFYSSGSTLTVSEISVKQVDPNDRWSAGSGGASKQALTDVATLTVTGGFDIMLRQNGILTSGKKYKITYNTDLSGITSGSFKWQAFSDSSSARAILNGTNTVILTANGSDLYVSEGGASGTGIFTFIMVEEQKYVASNLKLNSGNYKSADPVIVSTKSVDLDGTDDFLKVTNAYGSFTGSISAWIKLDAYGSTRYIYDNRTNSGVGYALLNTSTPSNILVSDGTIYVDGVLANEITTDVWHHVVITGQEINITESLLIGVRNGGTFAFFNGKIDEIGLFNTTLTSDQVIELYNQGVPSNLATSSAGVDGALIGYWKMGDGTLDEAPLIADQTNATLGSELVTNGDFATDSDWIKETGWTIAGGVASRTNTGTYTALQQNILTSGKTYQVVFTITAITSGAIFGIRLGSNYILSDSLEAKTYIGYGTANGTTLSIMGNPSFAGSIDNVSVKQVNGNPALMQNTPTIVTDAPLTKIRNYYRMGDGILDKFPLICDMVEPSLGSELVTNGDFATDSDWTKQTGITISGGQAIFTSVSSGDLLSQAITFTSGKTYKIAFEITDISSGGIKVRYPSAGSSTTNITVGVYEEYITSDGTNNFVGFQAIGTTTATIDNVSVKEVNGVSGLMTNMTEADITNDVPS